MVTKDLDPTKDAMTVIDHLMHPSYVRLFPRNAITVLSVANSPRVSISDSGFGLDEPTDEHMDLRAYIRDCLLFRMWHEDHCNGTHYGRVAADGNEFKNLLGSCSKPYGGVVMMYYETYQGMLRGSYDALHNGCRSLRRWCEQGSHRNDKEILIRFPYSVRSGLDHDVFSSIVRSIFKESRYTIDIMGL